MNGSCAGGTGAFIDQMATLLNVTVDELDTLSAEATTRSTPSPPAAACLPRATSSPCSTRAADKEDVAASPSSRRWWTRPSPVWPRGGSIEGQDRLSGRPPALPARDCGSGLWRRCSWTRSTPSSRRTATALPPSARRCAPSDYDTGDLFDDQLKKLEESRSAVTRLNTAAAPLCKPGGVRRLLRSAQQPTSAAGGHRRTTPATPIWASTPAPPPPNWHSSLRTAACSTPTITPTWAIRYPSSRSSWRRSISSAATASPSGAAPSPATAKTSSKTPSAVTWVWWRRWHTTTLPRHFNPDVDFIIDIGGQDMKCFKIRNGAVDSIMLNEACSSGCGSFIETFAQCPRL